MTGTTWQDESQLDGFLLRLYRREWHLNGQRATSLESQRLTATDILRLSRDRELEPMALREREW